MGINCLRDTFKTSEEGFKLAEISSTGTSGELVVMETN